MSADAIKRVCFVGIGNMGWPMAARLVRGGFEVAVTDAVAGRAKIFVDQVGGKAVTNLAEATKEAETMSVASQPAKKQSQNAKAKTGLRG